MNMEQLKKAVKAAHAKDPWRQVNDTCCSYPDLSRAMVRYQPKKRYDPISRIWVEDSVDIIKEVARPDQSLIEEKDEVDKTVHLTPKDPIQPTKPAIKNTYRLADEADVVLLRHSNGLGYVVDEFGRAELKRLGPSHGMGSDSGMGAVCD